MKYLLTISAIILTYLVSSQVHPKELLEDTYGKEKIIGIETLIKTSKHNGEELQFLLESALSEAKRINSSSPASLSLYNIASNQNNIQHLGTKIELLKHSIRLDSLNKLAYLALSKELNIVHAYRQSITILNLAENTFQLTPAEHLTISNTKATSYIHLESYNKALKQLEFSVAIGLKNKLRTRYASLINDQGVVLMRQNKLDEAMMKYSAALCINDSIFSPIKGVMNAVINGNIGEVHFKNGQLNKAMSYYQKFYDFSFSNNKIVLLHECLIDLSDIYVELGDPSRATDSLESSIKLLGNTRHHLKLASLKKLARIQETEEDYEDLYSTNQEIIELLKNESISTEELRNNKIKAKFIIDGFEADLKEIEDNARIVNAKSELSLRRSKNKSSQLIWVISIAFLLIILILLFIQQLYRKAKERRALFKERKLEVERLTASISSNVSFTEELKHLIPEADESRSLESELKKIKILTDEDWNRFQEQLFKLYPKLFNKLDQQFPGITKGEKRLFALIKIGLKSREISHTLGTSSNAIKKARQRLRKKLQLDSKIVLESFVKEWD